MSSLLRIDPSDAIPIWRQIEDNLRRLVVSRTLPPGTPVPSVRELARQLCINPATVAKAYQRLADAGVLVVRRGEGTYVAEAAERSQLEARDLLLAEGAQRYVHLAQALGADHPAAEAALRDAWPATPIEGASS